jgi:hypothetical protein
MASDTAIKVANNAVTKHAQTKYTRHADRDTIQLLVIGR